MRVLLQQQATARCELRWRWRCCWIRCLHSCQPAILSPPPSHCRRLYITSATSALPFAPSLPRRTRAVGYCGQTQPYSRDINSVAYEQPVPVTQQPAAQAATALSRRKRHRSDPRFWRQQEEDRQKLQTGQSSTSGSQGRDSAAEGHSRGRAELPSSGDHLSSSSQPGTAALRAPPSRAAVSGGSVADVLSHHLRRESAVVHPSRQRSADLSAAGQEQVSQQRALAVDVVSSLISRPSASAADLADVLHSCMKERQWAEGVRIFSCTVSAAYLPPAPFPSPPSPSFSALIPDIRCYQYVLHMLMMQAGETEGWVQSIAQVRAAYAAPLSLAAWLMSSPLFPAQPRLFSRFTFHTRMYCTLASLYHRCRLESELHAVVSRLQAQQLQPSAVLCSLIFSAMYQVGNWEECLRWFSQALAADAAAAPAVSAPESEAQPVAAAASSPITAKAFRVAVQAAHFLGRYDQAVSYHRLMQERRLQLDHSTGYEKLISAYRFLGQEDMAQKLQQEAEGKGLQPNSAEAQPHAVQEQQQQQQQEGSSSHAIVPSVPFAELVAQLPHQPDAVMTALRSEASTLSRAQLNSFFHTCVEHSLLGPATELLSALVQSQSPHIGVQHLISVLAVCLKQRQWDEGVRAFSSSVAAAYLPSGLFPSSSPASFFSTLVPDMSCYNFLLQLLLKEAAESAASATMSSPGNELRAAYAAPLSLAAWLMSSPLFPVAPSSPPSPLAFNQHMYGALVSLYSRCQLESELLAVISRLQAQQLQPGAVLCCLISTALHRAGRWDESLRWFLQALAAEAAAMSDTDSGADSMDAAAFSYSIPAKSFSMAIRAANELGRHEEAVSFHRLTQARQLQLPHRSYQQLLTAYRQVGQEDMVQQLQQEAEGKGLLQHPSSGSSDKQAAGGQ